MRFAFPLLRGVIVPQCIKKGPKNQMEFEIRLLFLLFRIPRSEIYTPHSKEGPPPKSVLRPKYFRSDGGTEIGG